MLAQSEFGVVVVDRILKNPLGADLQEVAAVPGGLDLVPHFPCPDFPWLRFPRF